MTIEQLRKIHESRPFRPFAIHLADGRKIRVPHPEFLWTPPRNQRTFVVSDVRGLVEVIDLLLVTSLKETNGRVPRRRSR